MKPINNFEQVFSNRNRERNTEKKGPSMDIEDRLRKFLTTSQYDLDVCKEVLKTGEYEAPVIAIRNLLAEYLDGTATNILNVNPYTAAGAILIAESCNWAAKTIDPKFYELKSLLILCAYKMGAVFGVGEDGAYYLYDKEVGVASFHDPGGEIEDLWATFMEGDIPTWDYPWSNVTRQDLAFDIAHDYVDRVKALRFMAERTAPNKETKRRRLYDRAFDEHEYEEDYKKYEDTEQLLVEASADRAKETKLLNLQTLRELSERDESADQQTP